MLDEDLFIRGHIFARLSGQTDDYDTVIPDYYFQNVLNLTGETVDSNGSEYKLNSLVNGDQFDMTFTVHENEFETDDGKTVGFEELVVQCTGLIIQDVIWEDPIDILHVTSYTVLSVK